MVVNTPTNNLLHRVVLASAVLSLCQMVSAFEMPPRNIPWYLPEQASSLLISYLGSNPNYQPYGVQKFRWDPQMQALKEDWVNKEISSPSTVPIVSVGSNTAYLIGARGNQWTLEAMDWDSGKSMFHYIIGGQRYNVMFAGTLIDMDGRIHYGTPWGRVRLNLK